MKKTILTAYAALIILFILAWFTADRFSTLSQGDPTEPTGTVSVPTGAAPTAPVFSGSPAPESITVLTAEGVRTMDMQEYLCGVVAAEMPARFEPEALKAQAVAARSYAMYCAAANKHSDAQVCTDYACCQAWHSDSELRENWGENYDEYMAKIQAAVNDTGGQYLSYAGEPVFAAFHSSSAGATEDCGQVWNALPYLISVQSPETADEVPNFVSCVESAPLDFRDTVLSSYPEADFTGEESTWVGQIIRDESGRVAYAELGGVQIKGTEIRSLFSLRSAAFELEYADGLFIFTVTGYGHGVGMSQYGANVMAKGGADYTQILAHYYSGTELSF